MNSEWQMTTWGNLATLEYGKGIRDYKVRKGQYQVYGTNGPIGWYHKPLCNFSSVIIGRKGAYRGIFYSDKPFFVIDTAFYLKPKVNIDIRWAYYCLMTYDINGMDSGSAIPSTSREEFYKLSVNVPTLKEQQLISGFLKSLDDRIASLREINTTLEAIAQALFKSWFVDFDPVRAKAEGREPEGIDAETAALFPDGFEESELGLVPEGWKVRQIGEIVQVLGGGTPSTKERIFWHPQEHHWVTPKDLSGISVPVLLNTDRKISTQGLARVSSGLLPINTVLLSSRAPIGYLAITKIPTAINQGFIAIPPNTELSAEFLLLWCKQNIELIKQKANGSTFMEISKRSFRPIRIVNPPAYVVRSFNKISNLLFEKIAMNERQIQLLINLRDILLPRLISGQLQLSEAEVFMRI